MRRQDTRHQITKLLSLIRLQRGDVWMLRFKVQGSRFKVQGLRFKVQGSRFKVQEG